MEIMCPVCKLEFEAVEWEDGDCPQCNNRYYWDEQLTEDLSDSWAFVTWKFDHQLSKVYGLLNSIKIRPADQDILPAKGKTRAGKQLYVNKGPSTVQALAVLRDQGVINNYLVGGDTIRVQPFKDLTTLEKQGDGPWRIVTP